LAALLGVFSVAVLTEVPLCPLAGTFGVPCPGCGLTRATLALLRGDLHAALHFHPLVWLLAPVALAFLAVTGWELVRDPSVPRKSPSLSMTGRAASAVAATILVLTLAVWLLRFAGCFGGPVAVTTLRAWLER
jgi:hypothetical protein